MNLIEFKDLYTSNTQPIGPNTKSLKLKFYNCF